MSLLTLPKYEQVAIRLPFFIIGGQKGYLSREFERSGQLMTS